jgi:peptide/nickel transport system substrate-binding protein
MLVEPLQDAMPTFFNFAVPPLNDVNVRRALNYATPREAIIKAVFKGMAEPSNDPVGRLQYWDPSVPAYPFDLAKAKALLKQSSAPNGFNITLNVPAGEPDPALIASIMQSTWAQLGVHVTIQSLDPGTFFTNLFASKFQMAILTDESYVTEQYPPDISLLLNFDYPDSGNHAGGSNYNSPATTALIRRAMAAPTDSERQKLFSQIQNVVVNQDAADITLAELPSRVLVSSSLRGFQVLPTLAMRFEKAWLAK